MKFESKNWLATRAAGTDNPPVPSLENTNDEHR
jgi:hypothetical protein